MGAGVFPFEPLDGNKLLAVKGPLEVNEELRPEAEEVERDEQPTKKENLVTIFNMRQSTSDSPESDRGGL